MKILNLEVNNIQNINFLRNLTQLTELILNFNNIFFMEPLRNLSKLQVLDLEENELINIYEL